MTRTISLADRLKAGGYPSPKGPAEAAVAPANILYSWRRAVLARKLEWKN